MKKLLKIIGIILGIIIICVLGLAAYINFANAPVYDVEIPDLEVKSTPEKVARGKKIVSSACENCHGHNGILEGQLFTDDGVNQAFGTYYTSNITQDTIAGIGKYTDGELYRLLRTGLNKYGRRNSVAMPVWLNSSEEDIYSIIAYLRSEDKAVQPSNKVHPIHEGTFLEKALLKFEFKPFEYQDSYPETPKLTNPVAYGKYIVETEALCFACHSENLETVDLITPTKTLNYLGGGYVFKMKDYNIKAPSILLDGKSEISKWTKAEFMKSIQTGMRPNQTMMLQPMHPFSHLSDAEVDAIYQYIESYSKN